MPTFGGIVVSTGGAAADGRRTLLDIVDELARPINSADETVRALAADSFRAAVRTMNRKGCWPWEYQDEEVSITANNSFSTASSAVKKPLAMHLTSGGIRDQRLHYISYDRFMELYSQNITSQPTCYTLPNIFETGQVQWFPIPGSSDTARFTYYRVTPAPRTESEAVEIPDYCIEAYMAFALAEFMKRLPKSQRSMDVGVAIQEARQAFREISAHVNSSGDRMRATDPHWGV